METHVKLFYTLAFLAPSAVAQVCDSDQYIGFDGAVTTPGFSVNNTHLAAGSGSLNVNVEKAVYDLSLSGSQPGTISWFGFFENNDAELQVRVSFRTTGSDSVGDFIMYMARNGAFGMSFDGEEQTFTSSMIYTWHEWTATFDWKGRSITMHTDYTSQGTIVIPDKVVGVEALKLSQGVGTEGKFDTLRVLCPLAPPTVVVEPACPTAKDGGKLVFNRGGRRIGTSDAAALVPNTKHCGTAESECAPLNACSVTSGNFTVPSADQAVWEFKQLMAGEEKALKVCFFHDALDEWVQVGTIPVCDAPADIDDDDSTLVMYIIITVAICVLLVSCLLFLIYRSRKQKEPYNFSENVARAARDDENIELAGYTSPSLGPSSPPLHPVIPPQSPSPAGSDAYYAQSQNSPSKARRGSFPTVRPRPNASPGMQPRPSPGMQPRPSPGMYSNPSPTLPHSSDPYSQPSPTSSPRQPLKNTGCL